MMDLHVQGIRNDWLDRTLPCGELRQAMDGIDSAMEAANLAISDANEAINGKVSNALIVDVTRFGALCCCGSDLGRQVGQGLAEKAVCMQRQTRKPLQLQLRQQGLTLHCP